jgi:fatty acid synthase
LGVNPSIDKLYPKVEWPVARSTQSISSLIKWDHSESYAVKKYPEHHFRSTASDLTFTISQLNSEDRYLFDHSIDGKAIFPATGYLLLAWRRFAASRGRIWSKLPVIFENVAFRRATFLSKTDTTKLTVRFLEPTGIDNFEFLF